MTTLRDLRVRAHTKFPRAKEMFFTQEGLEQASSKEIAEYRTWKIRQRLGDIDEIVDICSGIGGDTIAFALRWKVLAVEKDAEVIEIAKKNVAVYGKAEQVEFMHADILELIKDDAFRRRLRTTGCIFFDPARRSGDKRVTQGEFYTPPLSLVEELMKLNKNICVKVAPAIDYEALPYDCDIEFVSSRGECKEALLWFGGLKTGSARSIMATKLPEKLTMAREDAAIPEAEPSEYLYEPDPAFVRAHLIESIGKAFHLSRIDKGVAYLTGGAMASPVLKQYKIHAVLPYDISLINEMMKKEGIGRIDIKTRAFPDSPEQIRKKIKLYGRRHALLVFTKVKNVKKAIICSYTSNSSHHA
jgi:hypothetical protein